MRTGATGGAAALAGACLLGLAVAGPAAAQGIGDRLRDIFGFGNAPEPAASQTYEVLNCPRVDVAEGAAALRTYAGGRAGTPETLRSQLTITNVARECIGQPDGTIVLKVGVEGRALIGPAGAAGRFDAPVRIVVKRGDRVFANRFRRIPVSVPPGEGHASFVTVEEGIVVPSGADFDIEVGLGAGQGEAPRGKRAHRSG